MPGMGWFAQLADTEGNVFAVWQTDMAAGTAGAVGQQADQLGGSSPNGRGDEARSVNREEELLFLFTLLLRPTVLRLR